MVYCSHVCSIRHWQTGRERLWQNINKWKTYEKHVCVHVIIIFLLLWNARVFSFSWLLFEVALREVSRSLILWKRHTLWSWWFTKIHVYTNISEYWTMLMQDGICYIILNVPSFLVPILTWCLIVYYFVNMLWFIIFFYVLEVFNQS